MNCTPHPILWVDRFERIRWAGHVAIMGEETGLYRVLVVELEGKKRKGRPRRRCLNNISWITRRCGVGIWIELVWSWIESDSGRL